MLFNSVEFIIFASIFFFIYPFLKDTNNRRYALIIVASLIFYGWWDFRYLFLLFVSGFIDYCMGYLIYRYPHYKKYFLSVSLMGNLGILFSFKYLVWLVSSYQQILSSFGMTVHLIERIDPIFMILPVGISFYTFQSLSYTFDVYRGELKPTRNPLLFFAYISLFPQLVAGPIIRARDVLQELRMPQHPDGQRIFEGLRRIAIGFFKKVVIADSLAPFVNAAFASDPWDHGMIYWWVAAIAFAFQVYFDFSGYSDIAIGLGKWMGMDFKMNFNHPYISSSFKEFWSRWHISLSSWFRDYIYIPLGGSRLSSLRTHANLWVTMLISGLWHGASLHFVVWGALHAMYMSLERILFPDHRSKNILFLIGSTLSTFALTCISFVFFRVHSLRYGLGIVKALIDPRRLSLKEINYIPGLVLLLLTAVIAQECLVFAKQKGGLHQPLFFKDPIFQSFLVALLLTICIFYRGVGNAFIYFQF
ncbi:MAG: MBOAT family protein [Candidatus Omnitrophica bacterium]|nr:MBOAT family protein [Candidatus Omnitrophota bacterium]